MMRSGADLCNVHKVTSLERVFFPAGACALAGTHTLRCTNDGTDNDHARDQRGRVPTDPLPDWVPAARRAIGDRIRATRTGRKLSQEALAELVGVDRKTINRVEQGTHATSVDHLLLIAHALDVPLADLVR
jgi:DNA-binding XRE family transcriptional regulator